MGDTPSEILDFSIIKFPGIKKIIRQSLRAMKKPPVAPPPSSIFSKFRNPLKKDDKPPAKEIHLTNIKHRYNPVTKQYEFEGEEQSKVEEPILPPPSMFKTTEVSARPKRYVDVIGQDVDLNTYRPTDWSPEMKVNIEIQEKDERVEDGKRIEEQVIIRLNEVEGSEKNKSVVREDNQFKKELSMGDDEVKREMAERIAELEKSIEGEWVIRKEMEQFFVGFVKDMDNRVGPVEENSEVWVGKVIELENEHFRLSKELSGRSIEVLELTEKNFMLETQIAEMARKIEWHENEKEGIFNSLFEENSKLVQEIKNIKSESMQISENSSSQNFDLKHAIDLLQNKDKANTEARIKDEFSIKELKTKQKVLKNEYNWALSVITTLEDKIRSLQNYNFELNNNISQNPVNSLEIAENIKLVSEVLSLRKERHTLVRQQNEERQRIQELNDELHEKAETIKYLQSESALSLQSTIDGLKKELENEMKKLEAKQLTEKNNLNSEISVLKNINLDSKNEIQSLKSKIYELTENIKILNEKNKNQEHEISLRKNELQTLYEQSQDLVNKGNMLKEILEETQNKCNKYQITFETFEKNEIDYKQSIEELGGKYDIITREKEEAQNNYNEMYSNFEYLNSKHESLMKDYKILRAEHEKKLNESMKAHHSSEERLQYSINQLEEANKALEYELESIKDQFSQLKHEYDSSTEQHKHESAALKESHLDELNKLKEEKHNLSQEISIIKESFSVKLEASFKKVEQQQFTIRKLEREISENADIRGENTTMKEKINKKRQKLIQLKQKISELEQKVLNHSESNENYTLQLQTLSEMLERYREECTSNEETIKSLSESLKKSTDQLSLLKSTNTSLTQNLTSLKSELSHQSTLMIQKNSEISVLQQEFSKISLTFNSTTHQLQELKQSHLELLAKYLEEQERSVKIAFEIESSRKALEELELLKQNNFSLSSEIHKITKENEAALEKNQRHYKEKTELLEKITEKERALIAAQHQIDDLSEENVGILEKLNVSETLVSKLKYNEELSRHSNTELVDSLKSSYQSDIQSFESRLSLLTQEIEKVSNEKAEILRIAAESNSENAALLKSTSERALKIFTEQHEASTKSLKSQLDNSQAIIVSLKEKIKSLESQIASTDLTIASLRSELSDAESLHLQPLSIPSEDSKEFYEAQISSLNKEIDSLYEKNLSLMQQNHLLSQDTKKKSDVPSKQILFEYDRKLKDKEDELLLVKQHLKEFLEQSADIHHPKPKPDQDGWFTSVMGSIFLTDKERGLNNS